jgi:hypothetical protein
MEFQLISEENNNFNNKFVYFKLVGVGEATLSEGKEKISEKIANSKAFCLIYTNEEELRVNMHKFVDNFCDKLKEQGK